MQTCYIEYFENAWSCLSIMIVSPCRKLWFPKSWNQLLMFICMQKINFIFNFVKLDIVVKTLQTFYFGNFGNDWASQSKTIVMISRKPSCSSACKKSTSSLTSFSKYCKEIANLLFLGNLGMSGHAHLKQ